MDQCCIRALLLKPFSAIDNMDRMDLISKGRPTPALAGLQVKFEGKVLQFDQALYTRHEWLCGSDFLQGVFCWPCILFAQDRISYWTKLGYKELTGLAKAAASHEDSIGHIRSKYQYNAFLNKNIALTKQEKHKTAPNPVIAKNHKFLKTFIDAVHFLAESNCLLDLKTRQYVSLSNCIRVMKIYNDDEMVSEILNKESAEGQLEALQFTNDCIESISKALQESIKAEIREVSFVTVIVDEPADTPKKVCVGLRYIHDFNLVERMLGFLDTSDYDLATGVHEYLLEMDVGDKLVAQAWGATSCSTQSLTQSIASLKNQTTATMSLPYDVGDLINTLIHALAEIPSVHAFFAGLTRIVALFNETEKMAACLDDVFQDFSPSRGSAVNFVSYMLALTKNPVYVIKEDREAIVNRFKQLVAESAADMESHILGACAQACVYLQDETVIAYLSVFEKMFVIVHRMINWVSEASTDGFVTVRLQDIVHKAVSEIWETAQSEWTAEKLSPAVYKDVHWAIVVVTGSLQMRLEDLERFRFVRLFGTTNYRQFLKAFPDDLISHLMGSYERFFNRTRLKNELLVMYGTPDLMEKPLPFLLLAFFEDKSLINIFPQIYKLLQLVMTLPCPFMPVSNGALPDRVRKHTSKCVGQPRVTELAVIDANIDLLQDVKNSSDFFNSFLDDFGYKQREMELKQLDDQDDSEMEVVVSIRQGIHANFN